MEKASKVLRSGGVGWSDVRSWDALHDIGHKNANGLRVSVHGVNGPLIVASGNEVMILPCRSSQEARDFATDQQFRSDMDGNMPLSSWLNPSTRPVNGALHCGRLVRLLFLNVPHHLDFAPQCCLPITQAVPDGDVIAHA